MGIRRWEKHKKMSSRWRDEVVAIATAQCSSSSPSLINCWMMRLQACLKRMFDSGNHFIHIYNGHCTTALLSFASWVSWTKQCCLLLVTFWFHGNIQYQSAAGLPTKHAILQVVINLLVNSEWIIECYIPRNLARVSHCHMMSIREGPCHDLKLGSKSFFELVRL